MTQVIGAYQARQNFGEILEMAYYQGKKFLVKRGKKPMVYLLGEPTMRAIFELIDSDAALADTLAILSNPVAKDLLDKSKEDIKAERVFPLDDLLK